MPAYWTGQVIGAVVGAFAIWALFAQGGIDLGMGQTSFDPRHDQWASAISAEGIGTFILMFTILGIVDKRSPGDFAGLIIGGVVVAIIMIVGPLTGASLNPARAFGPELVSAIGDGADHSGISWFRSTSSRASSARTRRLRLRLAGDPANRRRPDRGSRHPSRPRRRFDGSNGASREAAAAVK